MDNIHQAKFEAKVLSEIWRNSTQTKRELLDIVSKIKAHPEYLINTWVIIDFNCLSQSWDDIRMLNTWCCHAKEDNVHQTIELGNSTQAYGAQRHGRNVV